MGLTEYNDKRRFTETPEPKGEQKRGRGALRFVVQKHDASSLHYDFRLELDGVLLSWAIPKGPSLNPADRRLAMHVEDHPLDYRNFEGIIPEGNYGAGAVIVWDEGTYVPAGSVVATRKEAEAVLREQYRKGSLKLVLDGQKLKGAFSLRRMRDEKSWLLLKSKDAAASEEDITRQDRSVKSGSSLAEVALAAGAKLHHPETKRKAGTAAPPPRRKATAAARKATSSGSTQTATALLASFGKQVRKTPMPVNVKPMMATLVDAPFDDPEWLFEIKWDGYRALAEVQQGKVTLVSRNRKAFTGKYGPVAEALEALTVDAVFDGEIVAVDSKGMANFQLLQNWQNAPVELHFYIFDLLWLEGYEVTMLSLLQRKELLRQLIPEDSAVLRYSDHVEGKGKAFFKAALKQGLEGIMAKRSDSIYTVGSRSQEWLKIKVNQRQEVVIAGFTEPRGSRKHLGALLLGAYDQGKLVYVGHTGSGFTTQTLQELHEQLLPLAIDECPFESCPKANSRVTWLRPELVCEIKFTEWTREGVARHPIFMGLRSDKRPEEVQIEASRGSKQIVAPAGAKKQRPAARKSAAAITQAKTTKGAGTGAKREAPLQLDPDAGPEMRMQVGEQTLTFTNLDKPYWLKEGLLKRDLVNYYLRMAPWILPYLKGRPQSLHRHPNGISGSHFFQKDMKGKIPDWIPTHTDFSESTGKHVDYLVCNDVATLAYLANLGCIELHPWHARSESWQRPDWCLIDLDPEGVGFDKVIECAQVVRQVLDSVGATSCVKTSGSTGIHICIPLGAKYEFPQSRKLAELIVTLVHRELPRLTSLERNPKKRKQKIYLDFLQNSETQTAAAPYSLRPKPGAPVSTPLHWDEVRAGLTPQTWNLHNIHSRVQETGDLFRPVLGKGIDIAKVLRNIRRIYPEQ